MTTRSRIWLSFVLWLVMSGVAMAGPGHGVGRPHGAGPDRRLTPPPPRAKKVRPTISQPDDRRPIATPANTVQSYIDAHRRGRFAEANVLLMEHADVRDSIFSNWLFTQGRTGVSAATADVLFSRKFVEAFQYKIIDTVPNGDNQAFVVATRRSPELGMMYAWALAPKRGAAPYDLVHAIDTYLTNVNFPVEQARMEFTLIQEADAWYISAIRDEKLAALRQRVNTQPVAQTASTTSGTDLSLPMTVTDTSAPTSAPSANGSVDARRQMADAEFNATLQSFNRTPRPSPVNPAEVSPEKKPVILTEANRTFKVKPQDEPNQIVARVSDETLKKSFNHIRNAIAQYAESNSGVPDTGAVYDWKSLREVVNAYSNHPLPISEQAVGFRFVEYRTFGYEEYVLLVELQKPQNGLKRVEITPYGVERSN